MEQRFLSNNTAMKRPTQRRTTDVWIFRPSDRKSNALTTTPLTSTSDSSPVVSCDRSRGEAQERSARGKMGKKVSLFSLPPSPRPIRIVALLVSSRPYNHPSLSSLSLVPMRSSALRRLGTTQPPDVIRSSMDAQ